MSTPIALKTSSLAKLERARQMIDSAREDMCNLEGAGYCEHYEEVCMVSVTLERIISRYRRLSPPTGVFTI